MAPHLPLASASAPRDLDLTDEERLLAEDYVEYHPEGVRNLLAALNLRAPHTGFDDRDDQGDDEGVVIDMAIYKATGNAHLATIFSAAS